MAEDRDFQKLLDQVTKDNPYARRKPPEKKLMTVHEMGDLLGIKKTDRYWLVHKNCFETTMVNGKMYVVISSFEHWYANQIKYQKVNGEEPGKELKEHSFSPRDIADLLGISECIVYDILIAANIETFEVDHWKRISKETFYQWYNGQTRYRTKEDREKDAALEGQTITMPEMAKLLGVTRHTVYAILRHKAYKDFFEFVIIAEKKRITKESFDRFLCGQDVYKLSAGKPEKNKKPTPTPEADSFAYLKQNPYAPVRNIQEVPTEKKYYTREEAAKQAKVSLTMITLWMEMEYFPYRKLGNLVRIHRKEFDDWLIQRNKEMEDCSYGKHTGTE